MNAEIVWDDEACVGFLDHRPLFPGHVLLIPRGHYETLADLPADMVPPLFKGAQSLQRAIENGLHADGTFMAINNRVSQSVPHLHLHIVPRRKKDGLKGFFWPRNPYRDDAQMKEVADAIRAALLPA
jgi:histidine triad (HIT) family protein